MQDYDDFSWTSDEKLAQLAGDAYPWNHYLATKVEFDGHGTLYPRDAPGDSRQPVGPLHVIAAVQPGENDPTGPDSLARLAVLDHHLVDHGIRSLNAIGSALDGTHRERSRAVFGLTDAEARELGRRFGQVAVFAWCGPRWSLLACAADRREHRGWRWQTLPGGWVAAAADDRLNAVAE